jgi:hypothetical protein
MDMNAQIEQAKKDLLSADGEIRLRASDFLSTLKNKEVTAFLISLLDSTDPDIYSIAAYTLRDIADNEALEPLMKAIFKKENLNYNGTLVFALQTLNCSHKFKELFEILFYHGYESKILAYQILGGQEFEFKRGELQDILAEWEDIKIHPDKCLFYEDSKEMIQKTIDGYAGYLDS